MIAEILEITPAFEDLLTANAGRASLVAQARAQGFCAMREDGIARVLRGDIALNDLRRAVDLTRED